MALATLNRVLPLLVCPRCRSAVAADGAAFRCTADGCPYSAAGSFPVVSDWPVLVDFERSVLSLDEVSAWVRTSGRAHRELHRSRVDMIPPPLRRVLKPVNHVAEKNIARLVGLMPKRCGRVLVIGGGTLGNGVDALYRSGADVEVIGMDLYASDLTVAIADGHALPLADGCIDAVVIQAVLEHVLDPGQVVAEIHRVLVDGGLVYAETPFLQHVHAGAYDFTRFTASGHRYLFRRFEQIDAGPVAGPGTQLLWSVDHLARGLARSQYAGRVVRALFFWLRFLDRMVPRRYANDCASGVYFLGRRSEIQLTPRDIVDYYPGAQRG
ncbi:class I SAM-dependent methyltransferase [Actinopolymorpha sp. NPDC004070]|uniref:class I SAM-dependent methyltransferase n=1 Tax=Actinopolymorpha sp. NPDC004070 TaxID=3154548 RepID=UPI0033A7AC5D